MAKISFNKPGGRPVKVAVGDNGGVVPPDPPEEFSPADSPNLLAWYDLTDADTLTVNGSNRVEEIRDKTGNGYHLNQKDSAASFPQYFASGGGNNKPYIKCQSLTEINAAVTPGETVTIYLVARLNSGTNNLAMIVPMNSDKTAGIGAFLSYPNQNYYLKGISNGVAGTNRTAKGFGVNYSFQIIRVTFKATGWINAGLNNSPYDWTPPSSATITGESITQIGFGWHDSQVLNVDIAEMLVYTDDKKKPDDGKIRAYFTEKYNITDSNNYMLFFGDSITFGYLVTEAQRYARLTANALGLKENNWAVSGLQVIPTNQLSYTPSPNGQCFRDKVEFPDGYDLTGLEWVVAMYGTNDTWAVANSTRLNAWKGHYIDSINRLIGYGIPANRIIIGNPPYQSVRESAFATLLPAIDEVITATGTIKCDFYSATEAAGGDDLLADEAHPNAEGHQVMYETLFPLFT